MPTANHALRICVWQKSASIDVMPWGLALDVIGRTSVGGGCTCLGTCSVNSFPRGTLAAVAFALPTLTVFDPLRTLARLRVQRRLLVAMLYSPWNCKAFCDARSLCMGHRVWQHRNQFELSYIRHNWCTACARSSPLRSDRVTPTHTA